VHKNEFEDALRNGLTEAAPDQVDSGYFIIGILEMRIWTRLNQGSAILETVRRWTSDFLNVAELLRAEQDGDDQSPTRRRVDA
jgi:hypothetical protein